ncbi:MAG: tricorn protease [Solirubrobacterales bacterium]|jgi:Tol biopolymer transport system component|nr:tricorn protease [Solirubrobacterales bacterium]
MFKKTLIALSALLALLVPAAASAASNTGAVVFSKASTVEGVAKGGLFAVKDGRLNQLTEDPTDTEPNFSPDGRTIAFARGGDIYSVRPDGSGQRQLTSGPEVDSLPKIAPSGRYVVFERRGVLGGSSSLYTVGATGGGLRALTSGGDDREAAFSADGKAIVFVRTAAGAEGGNDDLYSIRPTGSGLVHLTKTATVDEFAPRYFGGGVIYSRGESTPGPAAYADIYTMRRDGTKAKAQVAGVGSAYVEDVSPDGKMLIFRRDQGLWAKKIGRTKARKLSELPDQSTTTSVFSSDGKRVAAEDEQRLVAIGVETRRQTQLASGYDFSEGDTTVLGPVIDWQPIR